MARVLNDVASTIGALAAKALVFEVEATPKPGLVDYANSGAHSDMNLQTFLRSAEAVAPFLAEMAQVGCYSNGSPQSLFEHLRYIGVQAEEAMFQATDGVNTHKGAIFSVGIAAAAAGYFYRRNSVFHSEAILSLCGEIAGKAIREDFERMGASVPQTNGERLYMRYGIRGIRGEVADGFVSVRTISLPVLRQLGRQCPSFNDALVQTLLYLVAEVVDTNIIARSDMVTLRYAQAQALEALCLGGVFTKEGYAKIFDLDYDFITRNISPGGCADLLAVTSLMYLLETLPIPISVR